MSNTILSTAVWCELHGPTNIFCTQTVPTALAQASDTRAKSNASIQSDSASQASTGGAPSNGSHVGSPPSATKSGCASCSMSLPPSLRTAGVAPCMETTNSGGDVTYLSVRHPANSERYKALRSACIRALSCEAVPGRSGPVFFGDPSIGYTIAYIFRLTDSHAPTTAAAAATAGRRQYALMCTAADEQNLLQSWTFVTERFRAIVARLAQANALEVENRRQAQQAASGRRADGSSGSGLGSSLHSRSSDDLGADRSFLRPKGRAQERGLSELTGMEDVFVQLHAAFAWMLDAWRTHFEIVRRPSTATTNSTDRDTVEGDDLSQWHSSDTGATVQRLSSGVSEVTTTTTN